MLVLALCVSAEPMVVLAQHVAASGYTRARRVLAKPKGMCARRKFN